MVDLVVVKNTDKRREVGAIEDGMIFIQALCRNTEPNIFTEDLCQAFFNVHSRPGRQQGPWIASKGEHTQAVVRQCRWFKTEPKLRNLVLLDQKLDAL